VVRDIFLQYSEQRLIPSRLISLGKHIRSIFNYVSQLSQPSRRSALAFSLLMSPSAL